LHGVAAPADPVGGLERRVILDEHVADVISFFVGVRVAERTPGGAVNDHMSVGNAQRLDVLVAHPSGEGQRDPADLQVVGQNRQLAGKRAVRGGEDGQRLIFTVQDLPAEAEVDHLVVEDAGHVVLIAQGHRVGNAEHHPVDAGGVGFGGGRGADGFPVGRAGHRDLRAFHRVGAGVRDVARQQEGGGGDAQVGRFDVDAQRFGDVGGGDGNGHDRRADDANPDADREELRAGQFDDAGVIAAGAAGGLALPAGEVGRRNRDPRAGDAIAERSPVGLIVGVNPGIFYLAGKENDPAIVAVVSRNAGVR